MIQHKKIYEQVVDFIEDRILQNAYPAGSRLPAERQLAQELGVSRPSVRDALAILAERNLIESRRGDGHYVSNRLKQDFMDSWQSILNRHDYLEADVLDFRRNLESTMAALAAERRTDADLTRMKYWLDQLDIAYATLDLAKQSESDVGFHQAIAESSHNILFAQFSGGLLRVLHEHTQTNLANMFSVADLKNELAAQHHAIYDAIKKKQPLKARKVAQQHLDFVEESLQSYRHMQQREEVAQAIADNEQSRIGKRVR